MISAANKVVCITTVAAAAGVAIEAHKGNHMTGVWIGVGCAAAVVIGGLILFFIPLFPSTESIKGNSFTGRVSLTQRYAKGLVEYANDESYNGQLKNGEPHGYGEYTFSNRYGKSTYEG